MSPVLAKPRDAARSCSLNIDSDYVIIIEAVYNTADRSSVEKGDTRRWRSAFIIPWSFNYTCYVELSNYVLNLCRWDLL